MKTLQLLIKRSFFNKISAVLCFEILVVSVRLNSDILYVTIMCRMKRVVMST